MISFESVTKTYPGSRRTAPEVVAVEDVSFEVDTGTITVLAGSSGCGKTTLLRMVNRMVTPTAGTIRVDGEDIAALNPVQLRRSIGYVMQHAGLLPHKTVAENISVVPRLNGATKAQAKTAVGKMLELVALPQDMADRYPAELSGGQAQRVGVARALADEPKILLMDEPFGAVDPLVRADLQHQLLDIQCQLGTTILFVTHDMPEALRLGHHIILLAERGRIMQHGSPIDLVAQPANAFVEDFLGLRATQNALHLQHTDDGATLVLDAHGRPTGFLESS
ncbi:ABC transporter ATP-binding protein [Enteractinococcus helveticum]|uniref:ABC-type quaternary amine transporter n=1 Tax=Enteractinococcus helveticum TaxID=1837282 RepID=A0A1B7M1M2_9MICC|nr:ATP-binding cassette domain-containing protein [Enteractinococcus helveticum]OAV62493.1 ABC transporter ATP-binding protein [Enteractinococcus helveticum]